MFYFKLEVHCQMIVCHRGFLLFANLLLLLQHLNFDKKYLIHRDIYGNIPEGKITDVNAVGWLQRKRH